MGDEPVDSLLEKLQVELNNFQACHGEYKQAIVRRHQLDAQLNENTFVKNELDLLKDDDEVYKLIGPVMVKQDLKESKQNVGKRIDYILGEVKRVDELISEIDANICKHKEALLTYEKNLKDANRKCQTKCPT